VNPKSDAPRACRRAIRRVARGTGLLALVLFGTAAPAGAATPIRPWTPPDADSLLVWSAEAKARFQTNTGDSVGGRNFRAYDLVGSMGRRLLRSLGRAGMNQAQAAEAVLDSLGLDTEMTLDPALDGFALLMVHNPYRRTATSVGFLFWYRGQDLRQQGVVFQGGRRPRMRVWWSATREMPYDCAVVSEDPSRNGRQSLLLLRLNPTATFWTIIQWEGNSPDLGDRGEAQWVDPNRDGRPELVVWAPVLPDSTFAEACAGCPRMLTERLYVAREAGFELFESRLVPSPYATLVLFLRLLREQNRTAAARLLADPARVADAIAQGWGARAAAGTWQMEYAEPDQPWPRWLAFRFRGGKEAKRVVFHFTNQEGRWLIQDWKIPKPAPAGAPVTP
jgi:hypothetical protein